MTRLILVLVLSLTMMAATTDRAEASGPFGPLHRYLYQTAPYPWLQDEIIHCESGFDPGAYNSWSGASGLAQFMPATWAWGEEMMGYESDMWNPYDQIDMMNLFARQGLLTHWSCYYIVLYGWSPD